ncbi:MAG TPA: TIGR00282 family metallophosphoesterase [Candidatus Dojkabacteria bacterium]|jgi:metallophosphoesterase (TIGR00282 family)
MNILFIGDISGRPGRQTIKEILPQIKNENKVDFVIANAENSAGGRGVTRAIIDELSSYGIDFFTTGEHVWDIKDFKDELHDQKLPLVRPLNYERSEDLPGVGFKEIDLGSKGRIVVIALLGQTFMRDFVKNPFWEMDRILDENDWENAAIIVDFHTEATAEKITMGNYLRNRVTAVLGTHTHVGTIDARILGKTGYVTDVGMVGPNDASLWANFDNVTHNFKYPFKKPFEMEMIGSRVFNSVLLEIDDKSTGNAIRKCKKISRIDKYLE